MGNSLSNTDIDDNDKTNFIAVLSNTKIKVEKYDEYAEYNYNNKINNFGQFTITQSQELFTLIVIELYNIKNIISDRVLLNASNYFIDNAKKKYNEKYMLNVFLWYNIKHEIHLDKYELDQMILHTTNVHLIAENSVEKTKKIYINNELIFTLHRKIHSNKSVIEVIDNTVVCSLTRKMNRKLYDETIGKTGIKPNAITVHLDENTKKYYILNNGWFKIYFENSIIEQLKIIPVHKERDNIFSENRNYTKQDLLKSKRLAIKCSEK